MAASKRSRRALREQLIHQRTKQLEPKRIWLGRPKLTGPLRTVFILRERYRSIAWRNYNSLRIRTLWRNDNARYMSRMLCISWGALMPTFLHRRSSKASWEA